MKLRQRDFLLLLGILAGWIFWQPQPGYSQNNDLIISRVGLSQAQGTTFLTMILSRVDQPKIQPVADRQSPQLLIDFPKAKVSNVPAVQAGDQQLVKQVRTTASAGRERGPNHSGFNTWTSLYFLALKQEWGQGRLSIYGRYQA